MPYKGLVKNCQCCTKNKWNVQAITCFILIIKVKEIFWSLHADWKPFFSTYQLLLLLFCPLKMLRINSLCWLCTAGTKKMENEWRSYHCYPPLKSFSYNFFPWPRYWKVIWSPVCGSKDRMDERWVSLGHCLCFKAVWETARGEEFISSSEQSRAQPSRTSKQEFKGIISKQLEDDSHRWDWMSQILRRYWGELISPRRAMICGLHLLNHSLFGGCIVVAFSVNLLPLF